MQVIIDEKKKKIKFSGTIERLLKKLKLGRETVVVKVNGKLAPENMRLKGEEKVEIIKVVFGG
ncbi:MAG: MoaD/ThiS family protein [Candidatus Anstonellales archaeon]